MPRSVIVAHSLLMGRRQSTAGANEHYRDEKTYEQKGPDSKCIVVSTCKYCCQSFRGMSGPRKVAHLCGIPGENVSHCEKHMDIPEVVVEQLLPTTTKGRVELEARLAKKREALARVLGPGARAGGGRWEVPHLRSSCGVFDIIKSG